MARGRYIQTTIWEPGSEYRHLSVDGQWCYEMLVTQPNVSLCGVLPFTPKKWARLASDLSLERLDGMIGELEQAWYVIVDRDTEEMLIRTFVKHDRPWGNRNTAKGVRRQILEVESVVIRDYLTGRHPWLVELLPDLDSDDGSTVAGALERILKYEEENGHAQATEPTLPLLETPPSGQSLEQPLERPLEGPSGRPSLSCARTRLAPTPSPTPLPEDQEGKSSSLRAGDAHVDDDLLKRVEALGPTPRQREAWTAIAVTEPDRVRTCLDVAERLADHPVAYFAEMMRNGSWPTLTSLAADRNGSSSRDPDEQRENVQRWLREIAPLYADEATLRDELERLGTNPSYAVLASPEERDAAVGIWTEARA